MKEKTKKIIIGLILGGTIIFVVLPFLFIPKPAQAQDLWAAIAWPFKWISDHISNILGEAVKTMGAVAFKNGLSKIMTDVASQSASWIAGGFKEGMPMFAHDSTYWSDMGSSIAGTWLDKISKDYTGVGLCDTIDPTLRLNAILSLPIPGMPSQTLNVGSQCNLEKIEENLTKAMQSDLLDISLKLEQGDYIKFSTDIDLVVDLGKFGSYKDDYKSQADFTPLASKVAAYTESIANIQDQIIAWRDTGANVITAATVNQLVTDNKLEDKGNEIQQIIARARAWFAKMDQIFSRCGSISNANQFCSIDECQKFCPLDHKNCTGGGIIGDFPYCMGGSVEGQKIDTGLLFMKTWVDGEKTTLNNLEADYKKTTEGFQKYLAQNIKESGQEQAGVNKDQQALDNFQKNFQPENNFFGHVQILSDKIQADIAQQVDDSKFFQALKGEWLSPVGVISGLSKSPAGLTDQAARQMVTEGTADLKTYTGVMVADAVNTFAQTLISKVFQNILKNGLNIFEFNVPLNVFNPNSGGNNNLPDGNKNTQPEKSVPTQPVESPAPRRTQEELKNIYSEVLQTPLKQGQVLRLIDDFSVCPQDTRYAATNNCVVDSAFGRAIDEEITIQEAMDKNYLHPNWYINYSTTGIVNSGGGASANNPINIGDSKKAYASYYSLNNAKILVRAGIMPLGFQIAAEKISKGQAGGSKFTLKEVVAGFYKQNSPFYKLVNPNWRIKSPAAICEINGFTNVPNASSSERQESCLQWKDCTSENNDGTCNTFNYCTAYKNSWRFNADTCSAQFASCQAYTRTKDQNKFYWLASTLDSSECDQASVGCQWYCKNFDKSLAQNGSWNCAAPNKKILQCNLQTSCGIEGGCSCPANSGRNNLCTVAKDSTYCFYTANDTSNVIFLNRNIESCSNNSDGCSQFISVKEDLGTNLLPNSSFEQYLGVETSPNVLGWEFSAPGETPTGIFIIDQAKAYRGKAYAHFSTEGLLYPSYYSSPNIQLLPETSYIFSFNSIIDTEIDEETNPLSITFNLAGIDSKTWEIADDGLWHSFYYQFNTPADFDKKIINISLSGAPGISVDALQLESVSSFANYTGYKDYGSTNLTYFKKAPDYNLCYNRDSNGELKTNDDSLACSNFIRACNQEEVGCERYSPVNGDPYVPAIAKADDFCPSACAGYDFFREAATNFYPERDINFIPQTSTICSASEVGCERYTNLEKVSSGGESREFYSSLHSCQKPDGNCGNFYTWLGSETEGFQLKKYQLRKNSDDSPFQVFDYESVAKGLWGECPNDPELGPAYVRLNPNCKEFYSEDGSNTFYVLYPNTISCQDSCVKLRKEVPISASKCWPSLFQGNDPIKNIPLIEGLAFTKEGGEQCEVSIGEISCETPTHQTCVLSEVCNTGSPEYGNNTNSCTCYTGICTFMVDQQNSSVCSSVNEGCRQYKGNNSGNLSISFLNDFENGNYEPWEHFAEAKISYTNESVYFGGHSVKVEYIPIALKNNNLFDKILTKIFKPEEAQAQTSTYTIGMSRPVAGLIYPGKFYYLSLLIKGVSNKGNQKISAKFSPSNVTFATLTTNISNNWQLINLGPIYFNTQPSSNEVLEISSDGTFYLDFIELKNDNSFYAIKNSWFTPSACDQDSSGNVSPGAMIGCLEYRDRDNKASYFKSFSSLCSDKAVGCEAFINTQNSISPFEEKYNNDKSPSSDDVTIRADQTEYLINNNNYQCQVADMGCQRFGLPQNTTGQFPVSWTDVYLKNNPDLYQKTPTLCRQGQQNCEEFTMAGGGLDYFVDPKGNECEWQDKSATAPAGWFKKDTLLPCYTDSSGKAYMPDGQTYGIRYSGDSQYEGMAGVCSSSQVSCQKFIDPVLVNQTSYLANGGFEDSSSNPDDVAAHWQYNFNCNSSTCQRVSTNSVVVPKVGDTAFTSQGDNGQKSGGSWMLKINSNSNYLPSDKLSVIYRVDQQLDATTLKVASNSSYLLSFYGYIKNLASSFHWAGATINLFYNGWKKTAEDLNNCTDEECNDWHEYVNSCDTKEHCCNWVTGKTNGSCENISGNCQFNRGDLKSCIGWHLANNINVEGDLNTWAWNFEHGYQNIATVNLDSSKLNTWQKIFFKIETNSDLNPQNLALDHLTIGAAIYPPKLSGCEKDSAHNNQACESVDGINSGCCVAGGEVYFDNFELKQFNPYYLINNSKLDKSSCNGKVSLKNGCILLADETDPELKYNSVATYAKSEDLDGESISPIDCTVPPMTSNTNLQTQPFYEETSLLNKLFFSWIMPTGVFAASSSGSSSAPQPGCQLDKYKYTDYCKYCFALGQTKNDTNLILKVDPTRTCGEWLHCTKTASVWNKELNDSIEVCKGVVRCRAQVGEGKSAVCVSTVNMPDTPLTETAYKARDTSWFGLEPAGYSLYNFRPIEKLSFKDYIISIGNNQTVKEKMLTHLSGNQDLGVSGSCKTSADCPDGTTCIDAGSAVNPITSSGGICLVPLTCQAYPQKDAPFNKEMTSVYSNVNVCYVTKKSCGSLISQESCGAISGCSWKKISSNPAEWYCLGNYYLNQDYDLYNDCQCSYTRIDYGLGNQLQKYINTDSVQSDCSSLEFPPCENFGKRASTCESLDKVSCEQSSQCVWDYMKPGAKCHDRCHLSDIADPLTAQRLCLSSPLCELGSEGTCEWSGNYCTSHFGCTWTDLSFTCNKISLQEYCAGHSGCQWDTKESKCKGNFFDQNKVPQGICSNATDKNKIGDVCTSDYDCQPTKPNSPSNSSNNNICLTVTKSTILQGRQNYCLVPDLSQPNNGASNKSCLVWYPIEPTFEPTVTTNQPDIDPIVVFHGKLEALGIGANWARVWFKYCPLKGDIIFNPNEQTENQCQGNITTSPIDGPNKGPILTEPDDFSSEEIENLGGTTDYIVRVEAKNDSMPGEISYGQWVKFKPKVFSFDLSLNPSNGGILPTGSINTTLTISNENSSVAEGTVQWGVVDGVPSNTTVTFASPTSHTFTQANETHNTTITITTNGEVINAPNYYTLIFKATDNNNNTQTVEYHLTVDNSYSYIADKNPGDSKLFRLTNFGSWSQMPERISGAIPSDEGLIINSCASPDGKHLFFTATDGKLYHVNNLVSPPAVTSSRDISADGCKGINDLVGGLSCAVDNNNHVFVGCYKYNDGNDSNIFKYTFDINGMISQLPVMRDLEGPIRPVAITLDENYSNLYIATISESINRHNHLLKLDNNLENVYIKDLNKILDYPYDLKFGQGYIYLIGKYASSVYICKQAENFNNSTSCVKIENSALIPPTKFPPYTDPNNPPPYDDSSRYDTLSINYVIQNNIEYLVVGSSQDNRIIRYKLNDENPFIINPNTCSLDSGYKPYDLISVPFSLYSIVSSWPDRIYRLNWSNNCTNTKELISTDNTYPTNICLVEP